MYFTNNQIHFDDTIHNIKLKIIDAFSEDIPLEEIYLFCYKYEMLNPIQIYNILTQNNKLKITQTRLNNFLINISKSNNYYESYDFSTKGRIYI